MMKMQPELINKMNTLFQEELNSHVNQYQLKLTESKETIRMMQEQINSNINWKKEKFALLEKIEQLEQYSNISLVRAYSDTIEKQKRTIKKKERDILLLNRKIEKFKSIVAQEPIAQEPIAQEPIAQEPIAQEPTVQEPTVQVVVQRNPDDAVLIPSVVEKKEQLQPEDDAIMNHVPGSDSDADKSEDEVEFHYVTLGDDSFFLDTETNELYDALNDEEIGTLVGNIKKIKVKGEIYYRETINDTFYIINSDGAFEYAGKIVNKRAIFNGSV
jgi:hypothetical protein